MPFVLKVMWNLAKNVKASRIREIASIGKNMMPSSSNKSFMLYLSGALGTSRLAWPDGGIFSVSFLSDEVRSTSAVTIVTCLGGSIAVAIFGT